MQVEIVWAAGASIGESPTWAVAESALYWIDVKKPALYRLDPATGQRRTWPLPSGIGAFALVDGPAGAVVALRHGLFRLRFSDSDMQRLAPPPYDPNLFRFNEGAVDGAGRFWIGVMFDPLKDGQHEHEAPSRESLHRFTLREGLREEPDAAELHNGMAWSCNEERFYLSHSKRREIFVCAFDVQTGRLGARELFAKVPEPLGVPDGAAVDAEDGYWCALHGSGRVRRYKGPGDWDCDLMLPVSQPTMCAFGGHDLDELYITSASEGLSPAQREREPLAGALLRVRPGRRGRLKPYLLR